jgi:hypothetical protein
LVAYYDGSGNAHDSPFISLAAVAAPAELWPRFDALWREALNEHHLKSWHTADAMQGKPKHALFVEPQYRETWNGQKAQTAFDELNALVSRFLGLEHQNGFQIRTCTVNMADYRAVKSENPSLRPAEAICVNSCAGSLDIPNVETKMVLLFDKNERFRRQMEQVWLHGKKDPRAGWPRQVEKIDYAPRGACALQAADLIAWHRNRIWSKLPGEPKRFSLGGFAWRYFDRPVIEEEYPLDREQRAESLRRAILKNFHTPRKNR